MVEQRPRLRTNCNFLASWVIDVSLLSQLLRYSKGSTAFRRFPVRGKRRSVVITRSVSGNRCRGLAIIGRERRNLVGLRSSTPEAFERETIKIILWEIAGDHRPRAPPDAAYLPWEAVKNAPNSSSTSSRKICGSTPYASILAPMFQRLPTSVVFFARTSSRQTSDSVLAMQRNDEMEVMISSSIP